MKHFLLLVLPLMLSMTCNDESPYPYITNVPDDYDDNKTYPLLIFLHGAGERGSDLEKVKVHGPPKMAANGYNFPCILISPLCPSDRYWEVNRLEAMLAKIQQEHKIDTDRIYLTGLSMGGYGTISWACNHPEHFAAIAPICGGNLEEDKIENIKNIPIWAFHGAKDNVVPITNTTRYIDALKNLGATPKYTIYPEAGHDSWTATYDNPEFFTWLFAQKK